MTTFARAMLLLALAAGLERRRRPPSRRGQGPRRRHHHRSQGAHRGRRRRPRGGGRARARQPEPPRPRGPAEPHGQGASGRPARDQRARAAISGWRSVVQGANNPAVGPGAPRARGRLRGRPGARGAGRPGWTARWATCIRRAIPHYTLDPGHGAVVTANILKGLARVAPQHRAAFERNRAEFLGAARPGDGALERGARAASRAPRWWCTTTTVGVLPGALRSRPGRQHRGAPGHPALRPRHVAKVIQT